MSFKNVIQEFYHDIEKIINKILKEEFNLIEYFKIFKSIYFLNFGHLMNDFLVSLF